MAAARLIGRAGNCDWVAAVFYALLMRGPPKPSRFPIPSLASFMRRRAMFAPETGRWLMTVLTSFSSDGEPATAEVRKRRLLRSAAQLLHAGFRAMHRAILIAKLRRLERELLMHDLGKPGARFPQAPLILGDKWDF